MAKRSNQDLTSSSGFPKYLVFLVITTIFLAASIFAIKRIQSTDPRSQAAELADAFVTRTDSKFYVRDQEFTFVGFNLFDAVGAGTSPYSCAERNQWWTKYSDIELDAALKAMKHDTGATVLRFWAYQNYTKSGTDFSGMDKLVALAKVNGFKLLPVLDDGTGYCTEPGGGGNAHQAKWQFKGDTWYTDGYKTVTAPYTLSYRDYVKTVVTRYKDEPTIFGWMMMNEADTSRKIIGPNGKSQSSLVPFATDISQLIKSIDSNHLVTVGTQSNGASGATGQDFLDVYGIRTVDFAEAHDWGYWGSDTQALPGAVDNGDGNVTLPNPTSLDCLKTYQAKIACSVAQATQILHKPIVMGESGIAATDDVSRARRASLMDKKLKAFFDNQGAGYLYWQWNKVSDSEHFDVLSNTNDPLLPVIKKYAGMSLTPQLLTPSPVASIIPSITPVPSVVPQSTPKASPNQTNGSTSVSTPQPVVSPVPNANPSPSPTTVPSSAATGSGVEGESLSVNGNVGKVVSDGGASQQQSLELLNNGSATGTLTGPLSKIIIHAKPEKCSGSPHINVKVNGNYVLDQNIDKDGYQDYSSGNLAYLSLTNKPYSVEVIYNNNAQFPGCDRNVYIDKISIQ